METCLVLGARCYDFQDEGGKRVVGVTVNYVTNDVETAADRRGCSPLTISGPQELWRDLGPLPGYYEVDFKQRPGKGGRPQLQVVKLRFLAPLDLVYVPPVAG